MFLFTGPTPKLLSSCGASVVDLMACGHLTHKHTAASLTSCFLRNELGLLRPLILIQNIVSHTSECQLRLGLRPHSPVLCLGPIPKSSILGLSALDLFFLSHIHKISQLTNSQKRHLCFLENG